MRTTPRLILSLKYHHKCEATINHQISQELYAAHMFEATASYLISQEGALKQFVQFLLLLSSQEMEHTQDLMWLQNQRGDRLGLQYIYSPGPSCWENDIKVMECSIHLKVSVNQGLIYLHQLALEMRDPNLCDFLKHDYLYQQVKITKDLDDHITNQPAPNGS